MFSKTTISLLALLAISGSTSASNLARRNDELTTTSTEIVYVTITQTLPSDDEDTYTVLNTPDITVTTPDASYTTEVEDTYAPYPTEDESTDTTVEVPLNGTTSTWAPYPSGGYSTTLRANETTYSTSGPSQPAPTEDESGAMRVAGSKSVFAFALGVVGAVALML